jgi:hypothetical protein
MVLISPRRCVKVSLDSEMTISLGTAGCTMQTSEFNITHPDDTFNGAIYAVAHGAMVDVSFQGSPPPSPSTPQNQISPSKSPPSLILWRTILQRALASEHPPLPPIVVWARPPTEYGWKEIDCTSHGTVTVPTRRLTNNVLRLYGGFLSVDRLSIDRRSTERNILFTTISLVMPQSWVGTRARLICIEY